MKKILFLFFILFFNQNIFSQVKILFDATKAESAGNADWVIDADTYNVGFGNGFPTIGGTGTEANPQRFPTPAQSGINANTPEDFWKGGLSAWAVECVKKGYQVETLPIGGKITYNDASNAQDLSNYKIFVVCEPNILLTTNEKNALKNFIQNGGGLFMIGNHDGSDRNFDGFDSPAIWNDFMTTFNNPFGMTFALENISQTTTNIPTLPSDPLLNGSYGNVSKVQFSAGSTLTLDPTKNASVKGIVYKTGSQNTGNTGAMIAYATFGNGRVVAIGDSSPPDDGTGDNNDILYDGWIGDAAGNHRKLIMNATVWLANVVVLPSLTVTTTKQDVKCFGLKTGTASATASGGTGTYNYVWSNGATTNNITNIGAGIYSVTVTSGTSATTSTVTITEPKSALNLTLDKTNITCTTAGKIVTNVFGGVSPYQYKWSNNTTLSSINNITTSGNFILTITDDNGCMKIIDEFITENKEAPKVTIKITNPSCGNFCAEAVPIVGANYKYLWSDNKSTAKNCVNFSKPDFKVTVTDVSNGCTTIPTIVSPTQTPVVLTILKVINANIGQKNGGAIAVGSGGTGTLQYEWRDKDSNIISTDDTLSNVGIGIYTIIVRDAVGCTSPKSVVAVSTITSTNDLENGIKISISPNPTHNFVKITLQNTQNIDFSIVDLQGKIMKKGSINQIYDLDMSNYSAGMYFLKLTDGENIWIEKLLKE